MKMNKKYIFIGVIVVSFLMSFMLVNKSKDEDDGFVLTEGKLEEEFISYTLNGSSTELSYEELVENNKVNSVTCENGSTAIWNEEDKSIKLSNVNVPDYCVIDFSTESLTPQFISKILADNPTVSERTDFSVTNTSNTTGTIYKTNKTEDGSIVYYYSGNTTNNWVYFGGFYWRIIRTNEDGSVRLLYVGTSHDTTSGFIGASAFNRLSSQSRYVGYMYGGTSSLADNRNNTTSSIIKGVIDTWYQNNLLTNYDKYISKNAIYCNDRSTTSWSNDDQDFKYGPGYRITISEVPTYKCGENRNGSLYESTQATADKFSVNTDGGGNGQLTYGIALMTVDEVVFAGGNLHVSLSSPYAWYCSNSAGSIVTSTSKWWTMSPEYWSERTSDEITIGYCSNFFVKGYKNSTGGAIGDLNETGSVDGKLAVRPVLSIDPCAKVTGTGTPTDPYVIDEANSTC